MPGVFSCRKHHTTNAAAVARISVLAVALLCTVWVGTDAQFDASWTPSGDGPLPLSENYRSTLRKLCRLLEKDQLPPKLSSSRSTIAHQCEQLRDADAAAGGLPASPVPTWVLGVGAVVVVGMMFADRARGSSLGPGQALGGGSAGVATSANDAELRAQRAKFLDRLGGSADLAESLRQRQAAS